MGVDRFTKNEDFADIGEAEVNYVRYSDKDGNDNYVTQIKQDGREIGHVTHHADGSVWETKADGSKERIK